MSLKTQILLIIFMLVILLFIIYMLRKRKLELKYVLGWILCDVAVLVLVIFPDLMKYLSNLIGIYSSINMIFMFGFIFALFLIFSLTVALSRVTDKVRKLTQAMALRDYEKNNEKDSH